MLARAYARRPGAWMDLSTLSMLMSSSIPHAASASRSSPDIPASHAKPLPAATRAAKATTKSAATAQCGVMPGVCGCECRMQCFCNCSRCEVIPWFE